MVTEINDIDTVATMKSSGLLFNGFVTLCVVCNRPVEIKDQVRIGDRYGREAFWAHKSCAKAILDTKSVRNKRRKGIPEEDKEYG